jgi:hypothetical protein
MRAASSLPSKSMSLLTLRTSSLRRGGGAACIPTSGQTSRSAQVDTRADSERGEDLILLLHLRDRSPILCDGDAIRCPRRALATDRDLWAGLSVK